MSISATQILNKIEAETQKAKVAKDTATMKKHVGHVQLLTELLLESTNQENPKRTEITHHDKSIKQMISANERSVMMGDQIDKTANKETDSIFDF